MMNGFNEDTHYAILGMARELADLFEEHSKAFYDDGTLVGLEPQLVERPCKWSVSDEGMEIMGDAFEKIEPNFRANVFEHLLCELEERGIEFDIDQFKAEGDAGSVL